MGGVWEEPNVVDCTCPDDPTTTSGVSLMWSSTPVGQRLQSSLVLTLMGMLPEDCTDGRSMGRT